MSLVDFDIQQVWAQVSHNLQEAGGCRPKNSPWYLDKIDIELRDLGNEEFTEVSAIEELIIEKFTHGEPKIRAGATNVAELIGLSNITQRETREISQVLRKLFGEPVKRSTFKWVLPFPNQERLEVVMGIPGITKVR
ncbi:hypothetical protein CJF42_25315 [Pseudoalteromonas sp. NBT06-2]|uniref:hypothetical protein n=1 Tax=Pseudoalteromonas sp. NBT06-2 TaxID=2025950 RepID=UPI000BA603BB|nr:hypothetical protein [Pseudoalteromonas sp. NBT06-2]PAJ71703.1 hypothetical protein CJF42_25315 [Pseudoalteromonas sp. NBT06-2]